MQTFLDLTLIALLLKLLNNSFYRASNTTVFLDAEDQTGPTLILGGTIPIPKSMECVSNVRHGNSVGEES